MLIVSDDHTYTCDGRLKVQDISTVSRGVQTDITSDDIDKLLENKQDINIRQNFMSAETASDRSIKIYTLIPSLCIFYFIY